MSNSDRTPYSVAKPFADKIVELLRPYCQRIDIAGSLRREKETVGDIEIVCVPIRELRSLEVPKEVPVDLFGEPIGKVKAPKLEMYPKQEFIDIVNGWERIKGEAYGKQAQRWIKGLRKDEGRAYKMKLDLYMCNLDNWGYIFMIRTGSEEFSRKMVDRWNKLGFKGEDGYLTHFGNKLLLKEEEDLFKLLSCSFIPPKNRK